MLTMFTDQPGVQFYSGNGLDGSPGKGGVRYPKYGAFCLEAQDYPDAINHVSKCDHGNGVYKSGSQLSVESNFMFAFALHY